MSTYEYACAHDHRTTIEAPIGTARRMVKCACGKPARLRLGAGIYVSSTRPEVVSHTLMERRWGDDMPAYRRMRARGLQPPGIDGAARLEDRVDDQLDIDYHRALAAADGNRERVVETIETLDEWERRAPA